MHVLNVAPCGADVILCLHKARFECGSKPPTSLIIKADNGEDFDTILESLEGFCFSADLDFATWLEESSPTC